MGTKQFGIDHSRLVQYAQEIKGVVDGGMEVAIVIGGGNIFRGIQAAQGGMDRVQGDYMGMLATMINSMALQSALENLEVSTRLMSAIKMDEIAEPFIRRRAVRHLEKGRVVIFGAGAGLPYFSTDTVAAQRALEIGAEEVLVAKNGVDGVYTADPRKDPSATMLKEISYQDALVRGLKVVDATAFSLCMDNKMPMRVFSMEKISEALLGEPVGTSVRA